MRGAALALCFCLGCGIASEPRELARVQHGSLVVGVEVRGVLEPAASEFLGAPMVRHMWDFEISSMAAEGSVVEKGDVVLEFDDSELARRLLDMQTEQSAAQAAIAKERTQAALVRQNLELEIIEARARLRKAELELARPADLTPALDRGLARLDWDLAQKELAHRRKRAAALEANHASALAALETRLERARERVTELESDLQRMTVAAPRAGTVMHVTQRNRKKKQVGDSAWWGEKVLQIAALERLQGSGEVDEVDISRVAVGLPVRFRLEAHPDVACRGTVRSVASTIERESASSPVRIVRIEIDVEETGQVRARPGMRFEGRIELERVERVVLAPVDALFATREGPVAYRRDGSELEMTRVKLGRRDGDRVEVLAGLAPGDQLSRRGPGEGELP